MILSVDGHVYGNTREIARGLIQERLAGERVTVLVWKQEGRREEELEMTLDPFLRLRMRIELKRLQRELGISFIHVTHSQDEAMALHKKEEAICVPGDKAYTGLPKPEAWVAEYPDPDGYRPGSD